MHPHPFLRALSCLILLSSLLIQPAASAQSLLPSALPPLEGIPIPPPDDIAPSAATGFVGTGRMEAVRTGTWPAQTVSSWGSLQPSRYGPQRSNSSQGIPAHAYSPFDELRNLEHSCPSGGCDYERDHVLVKVASDVSIGTTAGVAGLTSHSSLNAAMAALEIRALRPAFPLAKPPKAGSLVETPDGARIPEPDLTRWHRAEFRTPPDDIYAVIDALSAVPGIAWAEPDYLRRPIGDPHREGSDQSRPAAPSAVTATTAFDDPLYTQQWHLGATQVPQAWDWLATNGYPAGGSRDIIVAVIDTGVDYTHPDLAANMWVNAAEFGGIAGVDDDGNGFVDDIHGADTVTPDGNPTDDHGHGTHVAGIVAAQADNEIGGVGVAYNTQIMALKAAQYSGMLTSSAIAEAVYYAVQKGADVINMSFGGYSRSQIEEDALTVAFGTSVLVAAAGNDGIWNLPCQPGGRDMYPAAYNWVLGVMASQPGGGRAFFSNFDCVAHDTHEYELMAPGVDIWSTIPLNQYGAWDGTSMSAPVVAGIAALARTHWSDKDVYSSRFIMGQIAGNAAGGNANAYDALTVAPKPELSYLEHWIFDTPAQSAVNDADGVVDAGETIDLAITIRNHWGKADPVTVTLDAWAEGAYQPDPYVSVVTGSVEYGAVGSFSEDDNGLVYDSSGLVVGAEHPFRFVVDPSTPNDHMIPFRLMITAGNGYDASDPNAPYVFESRFNVMVQRGRELPRIISEDMTLTKDDFWLIPDQTLIEAGTEITVAPGTQIQFGSREANDPACSDLGPFLQVEGSLYVMGTEAEPVELFGSASDYCPRVEIRNLGTTTLSYVRVINPRLGFNNPYSPITSIDHLYTMTDRMMSATADRWSIASLTLTDSIVRHMQGGLKSNPFLGLNGPMAMDTVLVDTLVADYLNDYYLLVGQSQGGPYGSILNSVFMQNYATSSRVFWRQNLLADPPQLYRNNAFLSRYWDPDEDHWMKFDPYAAPRGSTYDLTGNYWGTASAALIDKAIYDCNDDFNTGCLEYEPFLTAPASSTYPLVTDVLLSTTSVTDASALHGPELVVKAELVTFTVLFNRDMDITLQPAVSFGPDVPLTDYTIKPIESGWVNARTWKGTFKVNTFTGDGRQLIRIAGARAADDHWLVIGDDTGRFRFEIITSGTESMNLQATGGEGFVDLAWTQDDFDLLAGYNLYRSTAVDGTFTRVNASIIPAEQKAWRDTDVTPGVPYFYYFRVAQSDMTESGPSNIAQATPVDTIPPTIMHSPATSATYGMGLSLTADVTDNKVVQAVALLYRKIGAANYTSTPMTNTSGNLYSATIPGSVIIAPGLEYYIEASDGISTSRHGTASTPHLVTVTDKPTVTTVTPNRGPTEGGSAVTIAGSNFQAGASVTFGGAAAGNVIVQSSSQITCNTPPHYASTVDVMVANPSGGSSALLNGYTYESSATSLGLPDASGGQNASVEIPVNAANVAGLVAASFTVTFDPAVLTPTGATKGNLTPGWSLSANTNVAGQIRLSMASGGGSVTGSGVLANLQFNVNGAPASSSTLDFVDVLLNDGAIPVETDPGSFQVNQVYSVSGYTRYWSGGGGVPGVTLSLAGDRVYTGMSDAVGAYTVGGAPADGYTLTPAKPDGASEITAYDASLALQHDSGVTPLSGYAFRAADVNKTGAVTSMDAHYILEKSVDLLTLPFPGAGIVWDFDPLTRSYADLSANLTGQDFTAILLGDPSGNWSSGASMAGAASAPEQDKDAAATLVLPEVVSAPDVNVALDLALEDNPGGVQGVDLSLTYDPAVIDFVGAALGDMPADWSLAQNEVAAGTVKLGLAGSTPVSNDRILAHVTFRSIGAKGEASAVAFLRNDLNEGQIASITAAGEILIDTPPVLDLAASLEGVPGSDEVTLTWSGIGEDAHHYEVWRAFGAPYFTPETGGARIADNIVPAIEMSITDPGGLVGQPGTMVFYLVRAVDAEGRPSPTYNRAGVTTFGLRAGIAR